GPYHRSRSLTDRIVFSSIGETPYFLFNFLPTSLAVRLMTRVSSIRMAAMAKATSNSARYLAYTYRATVRVAPEEWMKLSKEEKKLLRAIPIPAVKSRAADSPTMRPMDRIQPVTMPSTEEGSTTVRIIRHFPAPRPR